MKTWEHLELILGNNSEFYWSVTVPIWRIAQDNQGLKSLKLQVQGEFDRNIWAWAARDEVVKYVGHQINSRDVATVARHMTKYVLDEIKLGDRL